VSHIAVELTSPIDAYKQLVKEGEARGLGPGFYVDDSDFDTQLARWDANVLAPWLSALSAHGAKAGFRLTSELKYNNFNADNGLVGRCIIIRLIGDRTAPSPN
jgi:hypothetical protein